MLTTKVDFFKTVRVPKEDANLQCDLLFISKHKRGEPFFYTSSKEKIIKFTIRSDKTIVQETKEHIDDKFYIEEFIKLNYKTIIKHWNGAISDREFLDDLVYIRYSSCSQPSYTCNCKRKTISKDDFYRIRKRIIAETKIRSDNENRYGLIKEYLEFYKNNPESNDNLLGLYISYFIQKTSYKALFDKEIIHLFADYLKTFHQGDNVECFWSLHDKALQGDAEAAKELSQQYWHGENTPDKDYEKCEYFALISIKNKDRYALFNYAMYLMDIRKDDISSMRFSLKIFLETALSSKSDEDYLTTLYFITTLLCDRRVDLDCGLLLNAMIVFLYDNYPKEGCYWLRDKINNTLANIAGCLYLGNNVKKDKNFAKNILLKTNSNYKTAFYLGCINNPKSSILNSNYAEFRMAVGKRNADNIKHIKYSDCKNPYEYKSILLFGNKRFAEGIEQGDRQTHLPETWEKIETANLNLVGKDKLNDIFKKFIKEKLC